MVSGLNPLQCQCWGETSSPDTRVGVRPSVVLCHHTLSLESLQVTSLNMVVASLKPIRGVIFYDFMISGGKKFAKKENCQCYEWVFRHRQKMSGEEKNVGWRKLVNLKCQMLDLSNLTFHHIFPVTDPKRDPAGALIPSELCVLVHLWPPHLLRFEKETRSRSRLF